MKQIVYLFLLATFYQAGAQSPALSMADSLYASGNYTKAINTHGSRIVVRIFCLLPSIELYDCIKKS